MIVPCYESIQAWFPSPATDNLKQDMKLDEYLINIPNNTIFIKVAWESMIDAGIHEWDWVVVEKGSKAEEWDIVVAVVDTEYTLKYYFEEAGKPYLVPANKKYKNIYPKESLEIFGVVVWVFRKIK